MNSNDAMASGTFSEEEKLPEGIDEDSNWFGKNLEDESDNTVEHEVLDTQIHQDELSNELDSVKDEDLVDDKVTELDEKPTEDIMETDSQSELLSEIAENSVDNHTVSLDIKKEDLIELNDIELDSKKHDISNELKEMFEEKSSDADELPDPDPSLTKHSLDTEITKEDKLKDIVPDDILGKDDSFDELDNDTLHQELEAHLSYSKDKELLEDLPDPGDTDMQDQVSVPPIEENEIIENQEETQSEPEISKSLDDLSFDSKTELLKNLAENIDTKEIDEIMEQGIPSEEESSSKDMPSDLKEITSGLDDSCVSELKDDLENQLQNITGEAVEELQINQESTAPDEILNQVDRSSIELNQENMMVEFTNDGENQVLIQINTDEPDAVIPTIESSKSESVVMNTSDGQTLVFTSEPMETSNTESDMVSQVEGGAEFLQAVTGRLEDVLMPVKDEIVKEKETEPPEEIVEPVIQPAPAPVVEKEEAPKEDSPKCCVSSCKSGKSSLKTTYRYFKPPVNNILYKKWEYIFNQARQQLTPTSLICELHFRTGLIYKRGMDRNGKVIWALREGALPKLSPSGVLRVTGGVVQPPSTTVQVAKPMGIVKSATTVQKSVAPLTETKVSSPNTKTIPASLTPKVVLGKKVLQKPVKTVATKVSNEVTDIGFLYKNPELVKVAQDEIANMDVLVCGECHSVFHILELFQAHKMANNCKGESNFKGNPSEPKPQVWAFLLWKSAQAKVSDVESSWKLYQRWCKMDERIRNAWIAAGKTLQEGNSIATLKLVENPTAFKPNKVGRPPLRDRDSDDEEYPVRKAKRPKVQAAVKNAYSAPPEVELDPGAAGDGHVLSESQPTEVENTHVSPAKPVEDAHELDQTLDDLARRTPELITSEVEIKQEIMSDDEHGENKENDRVVRRNRDPPVVPQKPGKQEKDEEEFVVEKIVSRRYNIKKKHFEYLLKWEGYPSEQNTWEPAENLGTCQHLLKAFEEALAKQQAAKQAANKQGVVTKPETTYKIKPPVIPKKKPEVSTPGPSALLMNSTGRPVRSSKKKAMDQVKVWCGSIVKPSEDDNVGMKRKASSDSEYEEELVVKRVKVELDSEDDSDLESVKKVEKVPPSRGRGRPPGSTNAAKLAAAANKPVVNGEQKESTLAMTLGLESDEEEDRVASQPKPTPSAASPQKSPLIRKMSSLSPHNQQVLVASAKGVVTVDPKQVPNLSSGVYIMSNKAGIVKVDNNKTLSSLHKSGVMKKPLPSPLKVETPPQKPSSGVVVLPRSEANTTQQKLGVVKKEPAPVVAGQPAAATTPARPPGLLKPMRPGVTPRPLGLLKPPTTPTSTLTPSSPPPLAPISAPARPLGIPSGINTKIQQVVRPRNPTPTRGRPVASGLLKRPVPETPGLQASAQQRLLIAKKKAETENSESAAVNKPPIAIQPKKAPASPTVAEETKPVLIKPKPEPVTPTLPPIKSTNKVFAHPLLNRGRGRGTYRGRGRGSSLGHLLQVSQREREPEIIKESKLVDSDNLLMEFQEPSDSEDSDDGLEDVFSTIAELPPIEPESPPRPLTLCPLTGKVLCKAEGEKTPEPTPPPSPKPPTPPPQPKEEPTHILPDHEDEVETGSEPVPVAPPVPVAVTTHSPARTTALNTTTVVKDGMICKVEMSPGGTTGTLVETVAAATATPPGVTEGTVTIKKPLASRNRLNRGPQLSVMPTNSSSTSLGTITVPARKLFQEDNGDDDMVTITGEDGLVYQVSNSELTGNTLLVSSGEDGQQQCVYVTTDGDVTEDGSTILTLDTAYADAVAQLGTDQVNILSADNGDQYYIKEGEDGNELMALEGGEGIVAGDDQSGQVVAQLVEAGEPAPGGSRRVVLLLPDGNLMMTEVDEEQYAALDLDK